MGISAAPFIANIFLAWFEYTFLCQSLRPDLAPAARAAVAAFAFSLRFLDDLLSLNNPFLRRLLSTSDHHGQLHGIYPPELGLSAQHLDQLPPGSVPFLDLLLVPVPRASPPVPTRWFVTRLYDKRVQPAFHGVRPSRFVARDSNVNEACKRNIFTGQFHRLRRVISDVDNFCSEIAALMRALETMGYPRSLLLSKFTSLLAGCPHAFYFQRRDTHPDLLAIVHAHLRTRAGPR